MATGPTKSEHPIRSETLASQGATNYQLPLEAITMDTVGQSQTEQLTSGNILIILSNFWPPEVSANCFLVHFSCPSEPLIQVTAIKYHLCCPDMSDVVLTVCIGLSIQ